MKKIIITGCPRTGSTALVYLLSSSPDVLVTNELATFHNSEIEFDKSINSLSIFSNKCGMKMSKFLMLEIK